MMPRPNKLKRLLAEGGIAFGGVSHIPSTAIVELMGLSGYDFDIIDTEHGTYDIDAAGELIRAAHGAGMTPLVRVLQNDPGLIMKALDLGAHGVIVPHIVSSEGAQRAVEAAKYAPEGRRGSCPYVSAAHFSLLDWPLHQEWANRETMLLVLIEDEEGVRNIDSILAVKGIDAVFLGPFDMSVGMGLQGNTVHPDVRANLDHVLTACRARNIPTMYALFHPDGVEEWVRGGVKMFAHGSDTAVLAQGSAAFLRSVENIRKAPAREGLFAPKGGQTDSE
jgi:4-hydroxy-2-oxoheptanedioate aldolase